MVPHADADLRSAAVHDHDDRLLFRRVFRGVGDEVLDDLREAHSVADDAGEPGRDGHFDPPAGDRRITTGNSVHDFPQIERIDLDRELPRADLCDIQKILGQSQDALGFRAHHLQALERRLLVMILHRILGERFRARRRHLRERDRLERAILGAAPASQHAVLSQQRGACREGQNQGAAKKDDQQPAAYSQCDLSHTSKIASARRQSGKKPGSNLEIQRRMRIGNTFA